MINRAGLYAAYNRRYLALYNDNFLARHEWNVYGTRPYAKREYNQFTTNLNDRSFLRGKFDLFNKTYEARLLFEDNQYLALLPQNQILRVNNHDVDIQQNTVITAIHFGANVVPIWLDIVDLQHGASLVRFEPENSVLSGLNVINNQWDVNMIGGWANVIQAAQNNSLIVNGGNISGCFKYDVQNANIPNSGLVWNGNLSFNAVNGNILFDVNDPLAGVKFGGNQFVCDFIYDTNHDGLYISIPPMNDVVIWLRAPGTYDQTCCIL